MALSRASITRGPGCVYYDPSGSNVALPSDGGIESDAVITENAINTDADGQIDGRLGDVVGRITWKPVGILTSTVFGVLYPTIFRNPTRGTDLLGSSDTAWLVHSKAGKKVTYTAGAVTRPPTLFLGASAPVFSGPAEVTCLRGNALEWSNSAAFYTLADAAYSAPTVNSADIVTQAYTGVWGTTLTSIISEAGWTIEPTINTVPDPIDGYGTNGMLIDSVGYVARCRPKNLSETMLDALSIQDSGVVIGGTRRAGDNLVITGTNGFIVTLSDARILRGPIVWRGVEVRPGEIAFAASRTESTGTYGALIAFTFPS